MSCKIRKRGAVSVDKAIGDEIQAQHDYKNLKRKLKRREDKRLIDHIRQQEQHHEQELKAMKAKGTEIV